MARKFLTNLDLSKNELQNARVQNLAAAPGTPVAGQIYYDTGTNTIQVWNGTAWQALATGTVADATTSSKGIIQLANALAGTAASPSIANNYITNAMVNSAAAIARSKLDFGTGLVNADIAAAAAIARSKLDFGTGLVNADISATAAIALSKLAVDPLARANHTGTQLAATISDLATTVQAYRLDQFAVPTTSVSFNSQRIINVLDPTGAQDAATKNYVDNVLSGLDAKGSVRAASTANLTLSAPQTVDGISLIAGDRVLVKDQTTASQNGIYVVAAGAWTRATDADTWTELVSAYTWVESGTANADTGWLSTVDPGGTLNTTAVTFTMFSASTTIQAGSGLTKTGQTLSISTLGVTNAMIANTTIDLTAKVTGALPIGNGGTGQTTAKTARETGLSASGYYSAANNPAATTWSIPQATHLLRASRGLIVQLQDEASGDQIESDINVAATGDVTITFASAPTVNSVRITIAG